MALLLPGTPALADTGPLVPVIVREAPDAGSGPELAVARFGGTVGEPLAIIGGFAAMLPEAAFSALEARADVVAVTPDGTVSLLKDNSTLDDTVIWNTETRYTVSVGDMDRVIRLINADDMWAYGYTGQGVDVAVIDSGVVPVNGLTQKGKVINGIDLSFESQAENLRYMDTYGHGTHMAGIIAGRDDGEFSYTSSDRTEFLGIAPDARIVSVKVADAFGAVDVSQVIAAIDWVVQHRTDNGMNIRVLNLSFGTDSVQDYVLDPLAFAAEQAWKAGIVVVVAAGNDGNGFGLRNPALDPHVIAVGALDPGTSDSPKDDIVSEFSNCGTDRTVDLVAPGRSIESLAATGAHLTVEFPNALVGGRYMKGSGPSQAAAVVSGSVALLLSRDANLTPDEIKYMLVGGASPVYNARKTCQGGGTINVIASTRIGGTGYVFKAERSDGDGSLDAARGSFHLIDNDIVLEGEQDIFGHEWEAKDSAEESADGVSWSGGEWNREEWSGASWSSASWSGASWSSASWSSASWSGASWSSASWSSASWSGASWSSASWSGASWSSASWSGDSWSGMWLGLSWT